MNNLCGKRGWIVDKRPAIARGGFRPQLPSNAPQVLPPAARRQAVGVEPFSGLSHVPRVFMYYY
jgi:hypothetical protein